MTPEDFIKKFCPDYENKMELLESEIVQNSNPVYHAAIEDTMFTDALQNFTDKICEAQRKECANYAKCKHDNDVFSSRSTSIHSIMDAILNAEQPKIEDL